MCRLARLGAVVLSALVATFTLLAFSAPAHAATIDQRIALVTSWTQPTAASYAAWNGGRLNPAPYADFSLDWSTDYCTSSPDQPLGYDFRLPCYRHDFGYRNTKALSIFTSATKSRVDQAFYTDLLAICSRYGGISRSTCNGLAWTYYQAVKTFGSVTAAQIQAVKVEAERAHSAQTAA